MPHEQSDVHSNGFDAVPVVRLRQMARCTVMEERTRFNAASKIKIDTLHLRTQAQFGLFFVTAPARKPMRMPR